MVHSESDGIPYLIVLSSGSDRGRRIPLGGDYMIVGREPTCDVRFDDPRVSRTHASLQRRGSAFYIQDLGSSGGTFVNGSMAATARELHAGDVLTFAAVQARLEPGSAVSDETRAMPARPAESASTHFHIDRQDGEIISNIGRDQYNSYVQQVTQQRENFLREVAATKTKARWLAWTGFLAFVVGLGLFAATDVNFLKSISSSGPVSPTTSPFGREIWGIPYGLAGCALSVLGMIMLIVGIVLHVIVTSRRRQAYRDFPVHPPRHVPGP